MKVGVQCCAVRKAHEVRTSIRERLPHMSTAAQRSVLRQHLRLSRHGHACAVEEDDPRAARMESVAQREMPSDTAAPTEATSHAAAMAAVLNAVVVMRRARHTYPSAGEYQYQGHT